MSDPILTLAEVETLSGHTAGPWTGPDRCRARDRWVVEDGGSWDIGVFRHRTDAALFAAAPGLRATARALYVEVERLRAERDEARAVIARIAAACATIDCEDLAAALTTPADYDDLVSHVEALANPKADPLWALLAHLEATSSHVGLSYVPGSRHGWLLAIGNDTDGAISEHGHLTHVIAAACDRLGVDHG